MRALPALLLFLLLGLLPALALVWCVWRFFRSRSPAGWWTRVQRAVGWEALCVLPVLAVHVVLAVVRHGFGLEAIPAALFFGWWVLLGGASVQAVFEETAKDVTGHRQSTMMDNWHYYVALTAVQTFVLALAVAPRLGAKGVRDPLVALVGAVVIVNAALGIAWKWWGT